MINPKLFQAHASGNMLAYGTEITLLDLFAAFAMNGFLSAPDDVGVDSRADPKRTAEWSYEQAREMLAEREKNL